MTVGLTRWTPTGELFRDRFGRLFDQMFDDSWKGTANVESFSSRTWLPAVDVKETDEALTLSAELPGIKKEDVEVSIENHVLTLSGERKFEKDVQKENFHRIERAYGSFSRSFTLPTNVKTDKVEARFEDGLLIITLGKAEEAKPRKVEIL